MRYIRETTDAIPKGHTVNRVRTFSRNELPGDVVSEEGT